MTKAEMAEAEERKFKSEVVKYACSTYVYCLAMGYAYRDCVKLLARCMENINAIGPETLREVAMNAHDGIYAVELNELCTKLLAEKA